MFLVLNLTCHGEPPNEQADVPAPDHDTLAPLPTITDPGVLVLPRRPDPDKQNQEIKEHDGHQTLNVDRHPALRVGFTPSSGAAAGGELETHGEN